MERVAFLIEKTGERLVCLLNPETVTVKRLAGLKPRDSLSGPLRGAALSDNPILYTGGGFTELTLDLLFDTTLDTATPEIEDVRRLTKPFADLAENAEDLDGHPESRFVRFVWGKAWNIPGVVTATSERLEYFTLEGIPRRSWLRMRLVRIDPPETLPRPPMSVGDLENLLPDSQSEAPNASEVPAPERAVEITGGPSDLEQENSVAVPSPTRLDELAFQYLGDAGLWRLIAWFNSVGDPMRISAGSLLHIPPLPPGTKSS